MAQYFSIAPNIQKMARFSLSRQKMLKMAGYLNRATTYYSFSTGAVISNKVH
jgi:hypothetical protein